MKNNKSNLSFSNKIYWLGGFTSISIIIAILFIVALVGRAMLSDATVGGGGYFVKPVYFVPNDGVASPQYQEKMQTAISMIQTFYADKMQEAGFGYRKLNLEMDVDGKPKIYFVKGQRETSYYYKDGDDPALIVWRLQPELEQIFNKDKSLVWAMTPFGPWSGTRNNDPLIRGGIAYTGDFLDNLATSTEGELAMFCDKTYSEKPADIGYTRGQLASIRLGGAAHEIGHAAGLLHSSDLVNIMSVGFNFFGQHFNNCYGAGAEDPHFSYLESLVLNNSLFFQSNSAISSDNTSPSLQVDMPIKIVKGNSLPMKFIASDVGGSPALLLIQLIQNSNANSLDALDWRGSGNPAEHLYNLKDAEKLDRGDYNLTLYYFDDSSIRTVIQKSFMVLLPEEIMNAPSDLNSNVDTSTSKLQVQLSWVDNTPDEDSFYVQKWTDDGGQASPIMIASSSPGTSLRKFLMDPYVEPNRNYYYNVKASKLVCVSTCWRVYSPVSSTTLVAVPQGVFQQNDIGLVSIEAEHFYQNVSVGKHSWIEKISTDASGLASQAMQAYPNIQLSVLPRNIPTSSSYLSYLINFTKTGTHYLWIRGRDIAGDQKNNEVYVGFGADARPTNVRGNRTTFNWTDQLRVDVTLPGAQIFNIRMLEDGFEIDKIVLTTDKFYTPSGQGPAESQTK